MKKFLTFFSFIFLLTQIQSQISVTGTVHDENGANIENAFIYLNGLSVYETQTGSAGTFSLSNVEEGEYQFKIYSNTQELYQEDITIGSTNYEAGTIVLDELFYPANEASAEIVDNSASLNWEAPGGVPDVYRHDDDTYANCMSYGVAEAPHHVYASAFRYTGIINTISWHQVDGNSGGHTEVRMFILGLDEFGIPQNSDTLFDAILGTIDNQWNTYELPQPLLSTTGFAVALRALDGFGTYIVFDDGVNAPYEGMIGNAYSNGDMQNQSGWNDFEFEGIPRNLFIRAGGFMIEEIEVSSKKLEGSMAGAFATDIDHQKKSLKENTSNKDVLSYDIYRLLDGEQYEPDLWTLVEEGVTEVSYTDANWSGLDGGVYAYSVIANYADGSSRPEISNIVFKDMFVPFTITALLADGSPSINIDVDVYNQNEEDYFTHYSGKTDANGQFIVPELLKGVWDIYMHNAINHHGSQDIGAFIFNEYESEFTLEEILFEVEDFTAVLEIGDIQEVSLNWADPTSFIIEDQFDFVGETYFYAVQNFLEPGWEPFCRESCFDFEVEETMELSRANLFTRVRTTLNAATNEYLFYPELEIYYDIKIHYDSLGYPPKSHFFETTTENVLPDKFFMVDFDLNETVVLEPGKYWFNFAAAVPLVDPVTAYYRIAGTIYHSGINNDPAYYRIPLDGYSAGQDIWYEPASSSIEAAARVYGRKPDQNSRLYNVYVLVEGDENNQANWTQIAAGIDAISMMYSEFNENGTYKFAINAIYENGETSEFVLSEPIEWVYTGIDNSITQSKFNCYPNPFKDNINLNLSLSNKAQIKIEIFDIFGKSIGTLVDSELNPGQHSFSWNGKSENGIELTEGIYFIRLLSNGVATYEKVLLHK